MSNNQGAIPRWVTGLNLLVIVAALAFVVPRQVGATVAPVPQSLCVCVRLSATAVKLTWSDTGGLAQGYIVQRSLVPDFSSDTIEIQVARGTTEFVDETQLYSTGVYYRVQSIIGSDRSPFSNVVRAGNAGLKGRRPSAPYAPSNLNLSQTQNALKISWSDTAGNETGMWVQRSGDNGTTWQFRASLPPNTLSYLDGDTPPTAPLYRVWTFNSGGLSASYAVQWLNPNVVTPSAIPSIGVPTVSVNPSVITSLAPSNVNSLVPSISTSIIPSVGVTIPGVPSIGVPSIGVPTIPPVDIPSVVPSLNIPDPLNYRIWIGVHNKLDNSYPLSTWILPAGCIGINGTPNSCSPPPVPTICIPITAFTVFETCYYVNLSNNP